MKVAIVHDYLNQIGGAEVVLEGLHELYPDAPVYTSIYAPEIMPPEYRRWDIRPSFMQSFPLVNRYFRALLPLFAIAIEQFDLSGYDLVLSSSSSWAKGVISGPETVHICYCHAPMRYVWGVYFEEAPRSRQIVRGPLALIINYLRLWDVLSTNRVDHFIANSHFVATKIAKYYRRQATVIYPPVDTSFFTPTNGDGDFYLVVSRLRPYKHIDLVVKAFNRLGLPLKIIGRGVELKRLQAMAGPNVEVLGFQPREALKESFAYCRALILMAKEDFGIAPLEAQSAGRPVVAYRAGGALETVIEGHTGVFFEEQTVKSLMDAVDKLQGMSFDKGEIRRHAMQFDKAIFKAKISEFVNQVMAGGIRVED